MKRQEPGRSHARPFISSLRIVLCVAIRTLPFIQLLAYVGLRPDLQSAMIFLSFLRMFLLIGLGSRREKPASSHAPPGRAADAASVHVSRGAGLAALEGLISPHAPVGVGADGGSDRSELQASLERQGVPGEGRENGRVRG